VSEAELKTGRGQQLIRANSRRRLSMRPLMSMSSKGPRGKRAIQKKVEGKEISLAEKPAARKGRLANVIDLMDMLRAKPGVAWLRGARVLGTAGRLGNGRGRGTTALGTAAQLGTLGSPRTSGPRKASQACSEDPQGARRAKSGLGA